MALVEAPNILSETWNQSSDTTKHGELDHKTEYEKRAALTVPEYQDEAYTGNLDWLHHS